jgi:hypothetical protein
MANLDPQENRIISRYTGFKIPFIGHIALFFNSLENKIAFAIFCVIIIVIIEFGPTIKKKIKPNDNEQN